MTRREWIAYWQTVEFALRFDASGLHIRKMNPVRQQHLKWLDELATIAAGALAACEEGTYQPPASFVGPYASFEL